VEGTDASVDIVCRTKSWIAFFPDTPATPGHTLVIPTVHIRDLWQSSPRVAQDLMAGVIRVGLAIKGALAPDGMNLISSAGRAAEQTVSHVHLHVVPRFVNDPIGAIWPPKELMSEALQDELAAAIREGCKSS
jgi:histidine triad (HIT) family protein